MMTEPFSGVTVAAVVVEGTVEGVIWGEVEESLSPPPQLLLVLPGAPFNCESADTTVG